LLQIFLHFKQYKNEALKIMDKETLNLIQFIVGIIFTLTGGILMILGILPLSARITIGIIGLILIATSKIRLLK